MRQTLAGPTRMRPSTSAKVARVSSMGRTSVSPGHLAMDPSAPLAGADVLRLQRLVGNTEVHRLIAQRAPSAAARHKQRIEKASPESYAELLDGMNKISVAAANPHGAGVAEVAIGSHLSPGQHDLLVNLRTSVVMAYSAAPGQHQAALNLWSSLQPDVGAVLRRAPEFVDGDVGAVRQNLNWVADKVIRPAAYHEAHAQAVAHTSLQAPDLAFQQQRLEEAEAELEQAQSFAEEGAKMLSMGVSQMVMKDSGIGKEIFELVTIKGTVKEKLEKAKEMGIVGKTATAIELVGKIAGLKNTIIQTTLEYLKGRAERLAEEAIKAGLKELSHHWKELAEGYHKAIGTLKTVGKVLGMVGVLADAIRAFKAAFSGDWEEALKSAGSAGMGVLGALGVEGSGALLGAITITIKAEIEAFHLAAEFIRWCKEETVREAAGGFIDACNKLAKNVAFDFIADIDLAFGGGQVGDMAQSQVTHKAKAMADGLKWLSQEAGRRQDKWPGMTVALGPVAAHALSNPLDNPGDPLSVAQMVRDVFAGANLMGKYVKEHYPTDAEVAAREAKEGGEHKEHAE